MRNYSWSWLQFFFPKSKTRATKILIIGGLLWYFGEGMFGPLLSVYTERIGGDILDISFAWATYLIVAGILYMVVGKVVDVYHNKESVMILGYALNAVFTFLYLWVDTPTKLLIVQVGLGIASALATPTWDALFAHFEDHKNDGFQWGIAGGSAQILTGLAILVGGFIIHFWSFEVLFIFMGSVQVLATIYQAKILRFAAR